MYQAQHENTHRLHPRLSRLEALFRELLTRPFDPHTMIRLMRMEVETMFPGLGELDQARIADIVLEQMQVDDPCDAARPLIAPNVIAFPTTGKAHRR